jgi:hypothetical protein
VSALSPDRPDKVEGRALSPRPFRHFGIEAVMLGPPVQQEGLLRRDGVAVWRRLEPQALVFDRVAAQAGSADGDLLAVRVVVATTSARDRALRVPAVGERAVRVLEASAEPPPTGWLLLVDEGPGETWLYLADEHEPAEVLAGFIGRRGRTDFARARRRSRLGGLASAGIFAGLVLIFYSTAVGIGTSGQLLGAGLAAISVATLIRARPR